MYRFSPPVLAAFVLIFLLTLSCSGAPSPVTPELSSENEAGFSQTPEPGVKVLWGIWDVKIDTRTGEIGIVPARAAEFASNVTIFLQPPMGKTQNLKFANLDIDQFADQGIIELDVGLTHPFPGLNFYCGFDVMGVFRHNGSLAIPYDSSVNLGEKGTDGVLLNPDGYTRWYNPMEFPMENLLGYVPGVLGTDGFVPSAILSPFKYFADDLGSADNIADFFNDPVYCETRGCFRPGSTNQRHYVLQFPMKAGQPELRFQYSVIANWKPPEEQYAPDYPPENFPLSANMAESQVLSVNSSESSLYYVDGSTFGGTLSLDIEVLDHQSVTNPGGVTGEINSLIVESPYPLVPGNYQVFDKTALATLASPGGPLSSVYSIDIPNCEPSGQDDIPFLITLISESPDSYNQGFGTPYPETAALAGYWSGYVSIGDQVPQLPPVGGELSLYWDCPGDPCSGQLFFMEISEAYDPEGDPVTVTWDFDGNMDFLDDMDGDDSNLTAQYVYSDPGTYEVWCRIDDGTLYTDIGPYEVVVSDCIPDSPVILKEVPDAGDLAGRKLDVNYDTGLAFVGPHYFGATISIIDIDPVSEASVISTYDPPGTNWVATVACSGDYLYASGTADGGVVTIDVSDPANPVQIAKWADWSLTGSMEDLEIVGDYLYAAAQWGGLMVFDISDPSSPVFTGNSGTQHGFTSSVAVTPDNQWGFCTDGYHNSGYLSWAHVIDLSSPSSPSVVKSVQLQNYDVLPTNCDLDGDYLYIVYHPWTGTGLLSIVDVSEPLDAYKVTDFSVGTGTWDVFIDGIYAYICRDNLRIVDVSDPSSPSILTDFSTPGGCKDIEINCGIAYTGSTVMNIIELY